jgi:hypothetical protein
MMLKALLMVYRGADGVGISDIRHASVLGKWWSRRDSLVTLGKVEAGDGRGAECP